MTTRYERYIAARDRRIAYARAAFADSVRSGVICSDEVLDALHCAEYAAWFALLAVPTLAREHAMFAWAQFTGDARDRIMHALRQADERWRDVVLPWYDAGCVAAGPRNLALQTARAVERDIQERANAEYTAWLDDWRAALLRIEARYTTRIEVAKRRAA